jgi:hypothetical protein
MMRDAMDTFSVRVFAGIRRSQLRGSRRVLEQ